MTALAFVEGVAAVLAAVPWMVVSLIALSIAAGVALLRHHTSDDNRYDLWDILMSKGKADLDKHIIVVFAVLTVWVIVIMVQKGMSVETLLLGALGIFVARRLVGGVVDTIKGVKPDEPEQDVIKPEEKDGGGR